MLFFFSDDAMCVPCTVDKGGCLPFRATVCTEDKGGVYRTEGSEEVVGKLVYVLPLPTVLYGRHPPCVPCRTPLKGSRILKDP